MLTIIIILILDVDSRPIHNGFFYGMSNMAFLHPVNCVLDGSQHPILFTLLKTSYGIVFLLSFNITVNLKKILNIRKECI